MSKMQKILLWAAAVLLVIGFFLRMTVVGMKFAFVIFAGLAFLLLVYLGLDLLEKKKGIKGAKIAKRIYLALVAAGFLLFFLLEGIILSGARTDKDLNADCVIVLGAGLDGSVPSLILQSRLNAAAEYLTSHPKPFVIVTGSQGAGEDISEGEAMRRYLVQKGISDDRIFVEPKANTTQENLRYSKTLLENLGLDPGKLTVAVVTSEFHLYRAKYLAAHDGIRAVGIAAKTPYVWLTVNYYIREVFGLVKDTLTAA